jgi:hypothetical protein
VKQEEFYSMIEKELNEVHQAIRSVCAVHFAPSSSKNTKLGDEPTQIRRISYETEPRLQKIQEENEKATEALKQKSIA